MNKDEQKCLQKKSITYLSTKLSQNLECAQRNTDVCELLGCSSGVELGLTSEGGCCQHEIIFICCKFQSVCGE